jgi:hypothetical protein
MHMHTKRIVGSLLIIILFLLSSQQALAFRCGNKLVRDGIHEQVVLEICGEPVSIRYLGYALRPYDFSSRRSLGGLSVEHHPNYGRYSQEVLVTEYVYNFGPRKLMRRLMFEDGILVTIESLVYVYREDKP